MADVRVIALCLAACSDAAAQPRALAPPDGWSAQPAIAAAAKEALGKARIDAIEAYGEPARGCYAVHLALRGSGNAKELADQVVRGLAPDPKSKSRKLAIKEVVKPTGEKGVLALTFESAPYTGRLRAQLANGSIRMLACFWSQREPKHCETACTGVLGAVP